MAIEDFDGDGDLDIAAVAFVGSPRYNFLYLENKKNKHLIPSTISELRLKNINIIKSTQSDDRGYKGLLIGIASAEASVLENKEDAGTMLYILKNKNP